MNETVAVRYSQKGFEAQTDAWDFMQEEVNTAYRLLYSGHSEYCLAGTNPFRDKVIVVVVVAVVVVVVVVVVVIVVVYYRKYTVIPMRMLM